MKILLLTNERKEKSWLEKCRQEQLSNRALVFVFYALDKCAKVNFLSPSDRVADVLHRFFGVSPKGIKNELELIYKKEKRLKIESRKQAEILKSFEEAYSLDTINL